MRQIHQYFCTNKTVTLFWMWVFFALAFGYLLLCMFVCPQWNFWLWLLPGAVCLYLRLAYAKAAYDPRKDRLSGRYVPYQQRKKKK